MALASVAIAEAQALLSDVPGSQWSEAVLLPFLQAAHRELQDLLWAARADVLRKTSGAITVITGALDLGVSQPADLVEPIALLEKLKAAVITTYISMTQVFDIPIEAQTATLRYWAWKGDKIVFLGASVDRDVQVTYRAKITEPSAGNVDIGIIQGELYLGPKTAALAARSVGGVTAAGEFDTIAGGRVGKILEVNRAQHAVAWRP